MPKFTGSLALVTLNSTTALRALDKELDRILLEGAQEWVRTVASIVPTWSGMSLASIQPIAEKVGVPLFVGVDPAAPKDRRAEGRALGSAELISESGVYRFAWNSDVFHLAYNEFNDATLVGFRLRFPGPYQSQKRAEDAFTDKIHAGLDKIKANDVVRNSIRVTRRKI